MQLSTRRAAVVVAVAMLTAGCLATSSHKAATTTMVTTQLSPVGGAALSSDQLVQSASILQRRIDAFTGSKAEVSVRGTRLEVRAAASATPQLAALVRTGRLTMRRVIEAEPLVAPTSAPCCTEWLGGAPYTPSAYASLDCAAGRPVFGSPGDLATREVVACSDDRSEKFHLGVAKVVGAEVKEAVASTSQVGSQIDLRFTGPGQSHFTALTREAFGAAPPTNRIAIVLDGDVLSAPVIQSVINGDAQITGSFTQAEAEALVDVIRFGALPTAFAVTS